MGKEKIFIILFVLLFIGSMVGLYILNAGSGSQESGSPEISRETEANSGESR